MKPGTYEQFSAVISGIYRAVQRIEREEMVKYGCKGSFAQYLAALRRHADEGMTSTQLCEACDKDKAAVSRAVAEMEERGLIYRDTNNEKLYRARLHLTEEGIRAADYVCRCAQAAVDAGGKGLGAEERRVFYAALELISTNLQSISKEGIQKK